jgi:hypothetical protein
MDDQHIINELKPLALLQKKTSELLAKKNKSINSKSDFAFILDTLNSSDDATKKISELLAKKNISSKNTLEELHHEIRTPMTPILAYTEMLLADKFGSLNDEQQKKVQIIHENTKRLLDTINSLDNMLSAIQNQNDDTKHEIKELQQEKKIIKKLNNSLETQVDNLQKEKKENQNVLNNSIHKKIEQEQEKIILDKSIKIEQEKNRRLSKKHILTISGAVITMAVITAGYSLLVVDLVGQEYRVVNLGEVKSGYVIQNLRGDTIDTWLSWRLIEGTTINVNLIDGERYQDKADIVKTVLLSEESIEIDNSLLHKGPKGTTSTYYVGWAGALGSIKKSTEFYIPDKFNLIESTKGEGDITIRLTSQRNGDGYSGYTKSIADDSQNQILKSEITIFEVDKLSKAQFETILRHELGHALGLAHSTAPEDLMHPTIETDYPYISQCNIDAMISLYDGGKKSEVTCEI